MKTVMRPDPKSRSVRYMLYSHYGHGDREDFDAYQAGKPISDLEGVRHLLDHVRGLKELLTSPGHEGLLVLFYAPGYERFLTGLASGESLDHMRLAGEDQPPPDSDRGRQQLLFGQKVARHVRSQLRKKDLAERVRFITPIDLAVILGRVNEISRAQFNRFLLGPAKNILYDTTKVIEAILRLRVLGNGVPVLRLDHDVIFRGKNRGIGDLGLFKAVTIAVRAYQLRMALPSVSTFLFSASYNSRALLDPTDEMDRFEAWSRAFATRIYPALLAYPDRVRAICGMPETSQQAAWDDYFRIALDDALARRFYGLKPVGLEANGTEGLTSIGAHPLWAVISGALLCLSDGAILDLPPFSNLRMNVMWIDDHLKYSLHRAMDHFTGLETLDLEPGLRDARMDDVSVTKARPTVSNLPATIFGTYLPTLLWGAIMDAWITNDPISKCRYGALSAAEQAHWRRAKADQNVAPLPHAMLTTLGTGFFDPNSETELRESLARTALKRIEKVRQLWAGLRTDSQDTFASYWAKGEVEPAFGADLFPKSDKLWQGIAPGLPLHQPIARLDDLSHAAAFKVRDLIDDTIAYVHWTLEWPRFVQIVRSIRQGEFIGDLSWHPSARFTAWSHGLPAGTHPAGIH
jgi:hypothetical protein